MLTDKKDKITKRLNKMYEACLCNEKEITEQISSAVSYAEGNLAGLDNVLKSRESLRRKAFKTSYDGHGWISDIIRYTCLFSSDQITEKTHLLLDKLEEEGFRIISMENRFGIPKPGTHYKGLHINLVSPSGIPVELQVHTAYSYRIKTQMTPHYRVSRDRTSRYSKGRKRREKWIQRKAFDRIPDIPSLDLLCRQYA